MAYVNGDRSEATCRELWDRIPNTYRRCRTFSDFWKAYASAFSEAQHLSVGKEAGEAAHMERWNNTLRQRVGRMARKTLSFSKDASWHDGVIHWFVVSYNSSLSETFAKLPLLTGTLVKDKINGLKWFYFGDSWQKIRYHRACFAILRPLGGLCLWQPWQQAFNVQLGQPSQVISHS